MMIFGSDTPLVVGAIYIKGVYLGPAKIKKPQPFRILRESTETEWMTYRTLIGQLPVQGTWQYFYEVSTD